MKILFAVQGTGNGHIARAKDIIPLLQKKGDVDILVCGIQADLELPFPVKYRIRGLSFIFGKGGGVDILATYKSYRVRKVWKEVKECPVENYDLVVNDFEPISAWACRLRGVKCIGLSHQGSLRSKKVPKPSHFDPMGWLVLRYYAPADRYYSFHFKKYDDNIFTPLIREDIRRQMVTEEDHYTVYLPAYGNKKLVKVLSQVKKARWQVFSKHAKKPSKKGNVHIFPINGEQFVQSMASAKGVLCGAGFETPAETLFLGKKLMVIPMKTQYEQHFNAEGLKDLGVPVIQKLSKKYIKQLRKWVKNNDRVEVNYPDETQMIIDKMMSEHTQEVAIRRPVRTGILAYLRLKFS